MTSCKLPPTSLNDSPNGFHDDGGGNDVTVPAGDPHRFTGNYQRTASSSPETIPVSRRAPTYPAGDFYNGQCPVPIPNHSGSHVASNEDATWFLGTGSPPPNWQGYCPEGFWMQNPYVAAAAAAANQQQAAHLLRYGSIPDDTWLQYPYVGQWENVTYGKETEDFRSIPRNRSSSDASCFAKKKRAKVKRTVTFATDKGGCDQIIDDKGPWVRNTSSEETLESPKKTVQSPEEKVESLKKKMESPKEKTEYPKEKFEYPKEKMESPKEKVESHEKTTLKIGKILRNGEVFPRTSNSAAVEPKKKEETLVRTSESSTLKKQLSSEEKSAAPQDRPSPSSPTEDRDKAKKTSLESPRLSKASESKPPRPSHAKQSESARPKSAKSQAEENFRRGRSHSMNGCSSSSNVTSSSAIPPTRRRVSLGNPGVKGHIDVTANLNVQFRYNEDEDPGERIHYGRKVTCRVDGQGGMEDATHVTYVSKDRVLITDMLNGKLHLFNQSGEVLRTYDIDGIAEPWAAAVTSDTTVAVTSRRAKCVTLLNLDGSVTTTFGKDVLQCPSGVACDWKSERILVSDSTANKIFIFTTDGELVRVLGEDSGLKSPSYVALSPQGEIIVSDSGNHCVKVFSWMGELLQEFGKLGKEDGCLKSPQGVATDSAGNILVCDHYNNRVSVFSPLGEFARHLVTSTHGIGHPQSLALTPDLKLYVTHGKSKATDVTVFDLEYGEFV